jgi:hypothetical protein
MTIRHTTPLQDELDHRLAVRRIGDRCDSAIVVIGCVALSVTLGLLLGGWA